MADSYIGNTGHVSQTASINGAQVSQSVGFGQPAMFGSRKVITVPPNIHLVLPSPLGRVNLQITNLPVQVFTTVTTYMPTPLNPRSGQILYDRGVATLMQSKGYSISEAADMANRGMQWAQTNFGYDYSLAESQFMGWINGAPHRADSVPAPDDAASALADEGRVDESLNEDDVLVVDLPPLEDDEHIYEEVPREKDDLDVELSRVEAKSVLPDVRMAVLAKQEESVSQGPDLASDVPAEYESLVEDRKLLDVASTYNELSVAKGAFRKLLANSSDLPLSRKIVEAAKRYLSSKIGNKPMLKEPDPAQLKALGDLNLDASATERSVRQALINEASTSLDTNGMAEHENRMRELEMIHNILFFRG